MTDFEILKKRIEGNMGRIQQLLEKEGIEKKYKENYWCSSNRENAELRHRLKLLRKEAIELERVVNK